MNLPAKVIVTLGMFCAGVFCTLLFCSSAVDAQISSFQHVIIVFQENRTPDNLFQGLCLPPYGKKGSCSITPTGSQYDILSTNWLDKTSSTGTTQPTPVPLANGYDPSHTHLAFTTTCDGSAPGVCRMDGAALDTCTGKCPPARMAYRYVGNGNSLLNPYLSLATQYGWGNYMFQTNQGPSFPAHQFIFGGTSAPSADDDAIGTFAAENMTPYYTPDAGCVALEGVIVKVITTKGETENIYPCMDHQTLADLFEDANISWKYYTSGSGSIWTAPNAIDHICVPSAPTGGVCTGPEWVANVVTTPSQALTDIGKCNLAQMNWVIPTGQNSDHPESNTGGGPSWVASIVNAIGNNPECADGEVYWDNTAIIVTWDDWGGWYDHEPPTFLPGAEGDYQYGFRVPFIFVSAYTAAGYVDNTREDFGSILRFVEQNFGIEEGALGFADARSTTNLTEYFNLQLVPRPFETIPAPLDANYFINDKTPPTDPDEY
jgi:phospholipase C